MSLQARPLPCLLAATLLIGIGACSSAPKPLPEGPPPVYEAPRSYESKTDIDHVPGEVNHSRPPSDGEKAASEDR